jgi:hypothetical protein
MLRLFVLVLILLNLGYFAWGQGWLLPYGLGPMQQSEPQRLAQQIRPEGLVILSAAQAVAAAAAASQTAASTSTGEETNCWVSGMLDESHSNAVRTILTVKLPDSAWSLDAVLPPEHWIVYMGKFANAAELEKKRNQLASLKVKMEALTDLPLGPGLSLGSYTTQEEAATALKSLVNRGVRSARLTQYPPTTPSYRLRLPALTNEQGATLAQVKAALPDDALQSCTSTAPQ